MKKILMVKIRGVELTEGIDFIELPTDNIGIKNNDVRILIGKKAISAIPEEKIYKIPKTNYAVYPATMLNGDNLIKLSGIGDYGVVDYAFDVRLLRNESNLKEYQGRKSRNNESPYTFYQNNPKRVRWIYPSDLRQMAFKRILQELEKHMTKQLRALQLSIPKVSTKKFSNKKTSSVKTYCRR